MPDYHVDILDPQNTKGPKIQAIIPQRLIERYYKYYPVRFENLKAAKYVLDNPRRIFSGVRAFNEGGWCFTGKPVYWNIRETTTAPFPDELVFAVYMNSRLYIYEARAEYAAKDDKLCPVDWQNRYEGLVWKATF
jgi:hypothetical protein